MSSDPRDTNPQPNSPSMLARLKGMFQQSDQEQTDANQDPIPEAIPVDEPPQAQPVPPPAENLPAELMEPEAPMAEPVLEPVEPVEPVAEAVPLDADPVPEAVPEPADAEPLSSAPCPMCQSSITADQDFCSDCGYVFPEGQRPVPGPPATPSGANPSGPDRTSPPEAIPAEPIAPAASQIHLRLKNRFDVGKKLSERLGVSRYQGIDKGITGNESRPIVVVQQTIPQQSEPETVDLIPDLSAEEGEEDEILPSFDDPDALLAAGPPTEQIPSPPTWPNVAWECHLLETVDHPSLPRIIDSFTENNHEYLILEVPQGRSLWDAWDDPEARNSDRYTWLAQIAEGLSSLRQMSSMIEGIKPGMIVVDDRGQARISDLSDLLPVPVPPETPVRGSLYTAPELLTSPGKADARSQLYSFGAMMYALQVGRELAEMDFEAPGHPKPYIPLFPDCHPALGRLMSKTFRREVNSRFPSDEAGKIDPSGLTELANTLRVMARTMDTCRLEIGAWTTIGMVRTGNEDAFSFLHTCETRQDDVAECALVLLADGMGGYEAGEVAAALALQELRKFMTRQPQFRALTGGTGFVNEMPSAGENEVSTIDIEEVKELLKNALKEANRRVHAESKGNPSRRGMGCTAEIVYIDGENVLVGHVGDSRTYHLTEGRLLQMTRDHTLVNRLVELGQLTEEEAEKHPRRNELQQALGGQPDVDPGLYHARLQPGDVVMVCSDGLINHVNNITLRQFLLEESFSAEIAARRLVNLTNINGATDNTTVVVVRAT